MNAITATVFISGLLTVLGSLMTGTPDQTVEQVQKGQAAFASAVQAARPHVEAVAEKVVLPAIDKFKRDSLDEMNAKPALPQK